MKPDEMELAIDWAHKEGWNPGLNDAKCFYNADPNGFFVGLVNGQVVSMISAVTYGNTYGFIGFYIVDPEFRREGLGVKIWNHAIQYLQGRIIGLDGVPDQISNYEKAGFKLAHRNITFKGIAENRSFDSRGIVELSEGNFEFVSIYDRQFVPAERDNFLRCWLSQKESYVLGIVDDAKLMGYGKIRKCREGYKIGPLFTNNAEIAEQLFIALQNKIPKGSYFTLDIPELNTESLNIADKFKMEYSFETARMYKNGIPAIDLKKVFGITTCELG